MDAKTSVPRCIACGSNSAQREYCNVWLIVTLAC